jgi:hypothetical protein
MKEYTYLLSKLHELKNDQVIHLANGGAKDFAEYRHVCGVIRGLVHAETLVKDLAQKMEHE